MAPFALTDPSEDSPSKGATVDRRTAFATARSTARRTARDLGRLSGRLVLRVGREVSDRVAVRRAGRTAASSPPAARPVPPPESHAAVPADTPPRGPSPSDVARVVQRNAAGLTRRNPEAARRTQRRRGGPGAKLPARAGRGIVGI